MHRICIRNEYINERRKSHTYLFLLFYSLGCVCVCALFELLVFQMSLKPTIRCISPG
jgi:hypothetical protein